MDFATTFQEALEKVQSCTQTEVKRLKDENLRLTQLLAQAQCGQNIEIPAQPEAEPIIETAPLMTACYTNGTVMPAVRNTVTDQTVNIMDEFMDGGPVTHKLDDDALCIKNLFKQKSQKIIEYDTAQNYYDRGFFQWVARSSAFEYSTLSVVVLNGIWIAVDVDLNDGTNSNKIWVIMDNLFCTYFTWELFIRFGAFHRKWRVFCDRWFVFDLALVAMMVFETWVMPLYSWVSGSHAGAGGNAQVLRLLRLLRLSRMAKMMRSVPELMILIKGTVVGIRSVAITLVLLGGITFVFAIAMRTLTDGTEVGAEDFPSVPKSAYTLIIQGVIPDNGDLMTALGTTKWYYGVLFFLFIFLAALTFMNMLIGILCDAVHGVSCAEKEEMDIDNMRETLKLCLQLQEEYQHTEMVTKHMFVEVMKNQECSHLWNCLDKLDVDVPSLSDNIAGIFQIVEGEAMEFDDFVDIILKFRATDQSVIKGIFDLRSLVHDQFSAVQKRLDNLNRQGARASMMASAGAQPLLQSVTSANFGALTHAGESAVMIELQKLENMLQPVSAALKKSMESGRPSPLEDIQRPDASSSEAALANIAQSQNKISANEFWPGTSPPPTNTVQATPANTGPPPEEHFPATFHNGVEPQELNTPARDCEARLDPEVVVPIPEHNAEPPEQGKDNTLSDTVHFFPFFEEYVSQLEFRVSWDGEQPVVLSVKSGGEGERQGVWAGDLLVEMNGMITFGKSREELLPILTQRPLLLKVERLREKTPV